MEMKYNCKCFRCEKEDLTAVIKVILEFVESEKKNIALVDHIVIDTVGNDILYYAGTVYYMARI